MPKPTCLCGFIHDLSPIPDDGWITVRDRQWEAVTDALILRHEIAEGLPSLDHPRIAEYRAAQRVLRESQGRLYECPECGRLMWEREGAERFQLFRPEQGDTEPGGRS